MTDRQPDHVLAAVRRRRFLLTGWPWRSLGYLVTTPVAAVAALPLLVLGGPWLILLVSLLEGQRHPASLWVGLALLGGVLLAGFGPMVAMPVAALERQRLRLVDSRPVPAGPGLSPAGDPRGWLRGLYAEPASWRGLVYAGLLVTVAPVLYGLVAMLLIMPAVLIAGPLLVTGDGGPITIGVAEISTRSEAIPYALVGLALLPAVPYLLALLAGGHAAVARALLAGGSRAQLRAELVEVTRSRARLVDAFETERRRIERDLHDGAQQRLVGLTLQLGLARLDLPPGSPAEEAVTGAHDQAKQLMTELRELIRGIHPKLLTDRGLPPALRELADRCPIPVSVHADLPGRAPSHLEAAGYFVVAEALTNAVKHSGATGVRVLVAHSDGRLTVEVTDDGRGGAALGRSAGTGLTGLADRVAVLDGRMFLASPPGGPTVLRVELPCHQSPHPSG